MTYSTTTPPALRWLVAAPLAEPPSGRALPLADALDQLGFTATVDVGPGLGAAGPLATAVSFTKLRAFSLTSVISGTPLLAELQALAERLGGVPSKRPAAAEVLGTVARLAG